MNGEINVAAETTRALRRELEFRRIIQLVTESVTSANGKRDIAKTIEFYHKRASEIVAGASGNKRLNAEIAMNLLRFPSATKDYDWGRLVGGSMLLGMQVMAHLIATEGKVGLGWIEELTNKGRKSIQNGEKSAAAARDRLGLRVVNQSYETYRSAIARGESDKVARRQARDEAGIHWEAVKKRIQRSRS